MEGPTNADRYSHPLIPVYSPELFRGTAEYYSRFRPRHPPVLLDAIERTVGLDHGDSLLDLACGTGEVSLALADRVTDMWAIDLEPQMVAVTRQNALDRGIGRIHWLVGRAEDAELPEDHFGLVAVGARLPSVEPTADRTAEHSVVAERRVLHRHRRRLQVR